ncbi:OprO/OprP family phosphate-selective porin [Nitrosospira multiformis]|uniref:OprO/OprP family phosphate-selective porin n=1 Tax=Nitrosospira multiformis TaxID=1231 RepID=UPI0008987625|nr:porin [Nitrosospira multiformis]SEA05339.1 phosphate-selective porin OprO and OprP [Nitrosospira multiformis]
MKYLKLMLAAVAVMGAGTSSGAFAIDLYVDTKTKHIFAEPGPDREPLGTYERVQGTPSTNALPAPEVERAGQPASGDRNARIKEKAERAQLVGKVESLEERFKESEKQFKLDKNGLQFETADKNFKFKIGGRIHTDYTHSSNDHFFRGGVPVQANDGAELRRGRLEFAGTFFKDWDFKSQVDFADNQVGVKDMFISYRGLDFAKINVGHQKQAFSRELQESSNDLMFMERSLMNVLNAPLVDRAIGVNLSSRGKNWTGQVGLFGESIDANNDSLDESWGTNSRITFAPLDEKTRIVHLGVAGNYRRPSGSGQLFGPSNGVRFRHETSHITNLFPIDSGALGNVEDVKMLGLEASGVYGPLSAGGEYTHSWIGRRNGLDSLSFHGWYGEAAWTLTGESRQYKEGKFHRVEPTRNFSFSKGGWGAWELAARIAGVDLNDGAFKAGEMKNFTAALNWYVNSNLRFMFNYDRILEIKDSPLVTASGGKPDDLNTFMFRSQIAF